MLKTVKKILIRLGIGIGVLCVLVLALMYIVPVFYADQINVKVKELMKESIKGEVDFEKIDLSFYNRFPLLTATVVNPSIAGVQLDSLYSDHLFEAKSVSLGVDIFSIVNGKLSFNRIYVDSPIVHINVTEKGEANYDVFVPSDEKEESDESLELKIDELHIDNAEIVYNDLASKLSFIASDFDYIGQGNMSDDVFDLLSKASIHSFDLNFDGVHYVKEKPILAKLQTKVDTKSLTFVFEKNDLRVKGLPVDFKGHFGFIENGYDMLFDIKTENATLEQLLSVIPPEYQYWLDDTKFAGDVNGKFLLKGKYVIVDTLSPNVDLSLKLKNGFIQNKQVSKPLENVELDFAYSMPKLDIEKGKVSINKLAFDLDNKHTDINAEVEGLTVINAKGKINSIVNLDLFQKAIGIEGFAMRGELALDGVFDGTYSKGVVERRTLRKVYRDSTITSIPQFDLKGSIKDGYFKLEQLPEALEAINFNFDIAAKDSNYKNTSVRISDISLSAMSNFIKGNIYLKNLRDYNIEADVDAKVDLGNIKEFIPIEDIVLRGVIDAKGSIKGTYEPKRKLFPVIDSEIKFVNGYVQFKRIPDLPIENIQIHTIIKSKRGSLHDLTIKVLPIDFKIAGEPFQLAASLYNLNNLNYNVKSKGTLNIGNLYKLFKIDGIDVRGRLLTSLFLSGLQSDAVKGDFDKLKNGGKFEVDNITVTSEMFPKPLHIKKGVFKFYKEKMKFEKFEATYGSSKFSMNGYLTNVIGYMLKGDTLKGNFDLQTPYMNVDEFMMFANNKTSNVTIANTSNAGVIQVPKDINIAFNAVADKIKYTEYNIENFTGNLVVSKGGIDLKDTKFNLIGTNVAMNGTYEPTGYRSALFSYHLKASEFDIQRAYKEITLFREMVTMAKDAYGTVSLDYSLKGKLNSSMFPVMKSIEGQGTLSLANISFKGFKLLGAIADKTDAKSLEKGTLSDVNIKSSIKDNVMTIERTKMKMAGFRPRFEGQVSLDGDLNIGFRLGLPPLGIIGIPMRITGNAEDFKIKLGRYKASEVLGQGAKDDDEDEDEGTDVKSVNDSIPALPEVLPVQAPDSLPKSA
ncbi:AsmA-like C-terminal region-containing protein [Myroides odoratimimus]|uniref:AsmA-like C-terminal region-containing protein n=1 Tax=Myroides odoratimimus TaxID=76832 RepID=UPI0024C0A085|nr:AsmA-like C-terminal region-containing protein [Myroides odoratimimus]WHT73921.1 AsmA-like C-terminal region-containing protein [Myroides odoratimimus]WHU38504.1 AsmA-like C-terminal region-containing protein [Myroides odoratimimus]